MKIISVVGARPNFMKIAPIYKKLNERRQDLKRIENSTLNIEHLICHTGQHYDEKMSDIFFQQLGLPKPDFYLGVGSGTQAEQTGKIMIEFEKVLEKIKPDLVIVVGDVNSTIACSLTAKKLHIKVAHVEAGLRSFDSKMPEEINRILTDSISDYLFVTEQSGLANLKKEGIDTSKIFFVGNCMIDSLINFLPSINRSDILAKLNLHKQEYVLATMHRPSNVDFENRLIELTHLLNSIADKRKVVFPIHPRTKKKLEQFQLLEKLNSNIELTDPIGYIDFAALIKNAELIITDSGGIQEESTYLGIQCITLRKSTERPSTVDVGTNQLIGENFEEAQKAALNVLNGYRKKGTIPELWDGKAAERIVEIILKNQ
jgi:UDP-N-acetylglucosamine 2-epimerase (non-hydrolysing)